MTQEIIPVILCGGSGTRLWPVSRRSHPKQFAALTGQESLFQQTAQRMSAPGFAPPLIVTHSDFRFTVTQQLAEVGIDPGPILIEPDARNTGPALLAAALVAARADPAALLLAAPADHAIADPAAFRDAVARGRDAALRGRIVTFGAEPDRPETGYGYLEPGGDAAPVMPLRRFVEKPCEADARRMVDNGHLWNAGLFLAHARTLIEAFAEHAPDLFAAVTAAVEAARPDLGFLRLDRRSWRACPDLSVDYAVMEAARNLDVVRLPCAWSDLGGWEAIYRHAETDAQGVVRQGPAESFDCRDTLLRAEEGGQRLIGLGLDNVVAIAMPDAVLVADRGRVGELGQVVRAMRNANMAQADSFPKVHRPWGHFETLIRGDGFLVKRIVVNPGGLLSLQKHLHRAEHWVVVAGVARATIGPDVRRVTENESVFIPVGTVHRLENPGTEPVELIEVQTGAFLDEDDIVRFDDRYARATADHDVALT
ncbi:mannose-1-phosphate guanylyltransferase/mannose-6-phosphate isomerase [Jannaschia sp. S6380]|uniref:mannose-1-phosphate guanylyltransferase/mannose-6-phosphate isomerase n=1 Tax=Jannaschia sp. S6380 TaxID=2926408 RepID=UPI001FF2A355|nr:mannose-1-phosphate guanylyltransferase/mannose-6-phosphate isomerase [Jannaschia sp. S6380]MCK0168313.1 mannose-1-phosphate guanylyltransferase/mannose-6-phosphate isomerase [Jannaschia sp. S6380]